MKAVSITNLSAEETAAVVAAMKKEHAGYYARHSREISHLPPPFQRYAGYSRVEGAGGDFGAHQWCTSTGNVIAVRDDGMVIVSGRRHGISWDFLQRVGIDPAQMEWQLTHSMSSAPPYCDGEGNSLLS